MMGTEKHGAGQIEKEKHTVLMAMIKTDVFEVSYCTETQVLTAFQPFPCVLNWWNHIVNIETCLLVYKSQRQQFLQVLHEINIFNISTGNIKS